MNDGPESIAARHLAVLDRVLPGRVEGLYIVGSTALGAWRRDHSDIDVVGVLDRHLTPAELRKLRAAQLISGVSAVSRMIGRRKYNAHNTVNGAYIAASDLRAPVSTITPIASHTGHQFQAGRAFGVNPVEWAVFATRGIALRGPAPAQLGLDPEPGTLKQWNLNNLRSYWARWAQSTSRRADAHWRVRPRWMTAWAVLGAPRLHCTIATGEIISKEAAGEYARATFDDEWHSLIDEALAYWRDQPAIPLNGRRERTNEFVLEVVRSAAAL